MNAQNPEPKMDKPTENAEYWFRQADHNSSILMFPHRDLSDSDRDFYIGNSLHDLAKGLGHLAVGLRATYILLDQVNRKLDQQRR